MNQNIAIFQRTFCTTRENNLLFRPQQILKSHPDATTCTVFENHTKSLIQHCERSELRFHFEWTKVHEKWQKLVNLASFDQPETCSQTVLPDRSLLVGQKLMESAKNWKTQMRHFR